MTISLANVSRRAESMLKTIDGFPFPGTIFAQNEGTVPSYDFSEPRFLVRVRMSSPVVSGMIIVGIDGRKFITADHDQASLSGEMLYRTLKLFPANRNMKWERETTITDTLTGLEKGTGKADLGTIWCMNEPITKEPIDLTLRIKEQMFRIITNADIKENDVLDGMIVRRIDNVLGVKLIELQ